MKISNHQYRMLASRVQWKPPADVEIKTSTPIQIKAFVAEESLRSGVNPVTVYRRICSGYYPHKFTLSNRSDSRRDAVAVVETVEVRMKDFLASEARRLGLAPSTIHYRISTGKYPSLTIRRVGARTVFVR